MRKIAALCLVVVLLAGAVGPGLAAQGGPPDHANDDGGGPPDHANAGDDDRDEDRAEDSDDERTGEEADREGDESDDNDDGGGVLSTVENAVGDDGEATPTAADRATSTRSDDSETPMNPAEPVLQIFETPEDTPEDTPESTAEETPEEESPEETDGPSSSERDPLPDPRETETPTPTPEPTETPRETREDEPESTPEPTSESSDADDDDRADDGSSGDDDHSGSSPGSDSDQTATPTPSEPSIEYASSDDATRASIEDVRAGQTVEVPLRGPATDGEGVAVEAVDVGVESGEPFTLTVTRPTADGGEATAPGIAVGYFEVETDHDAVENATLTLSVDESALPEGVAAEDLEVLRYADGEWRSTETTYDESAGVYTVETDGFSQFALAAPNENPLEVTDVAVDETESEDGAATVRATVENTLDRQATGTVAISVDGETVETRQVTLGGGETATVTYDLPAEQAEGGNVSVDGVESERLQVQETETETAAGAVDGNLVFGVGAAAFLVLSAVGTGLLAARSDELDWER